MRWRWVPLALGAITRIAALPSVAVRTRAEQVRRPIGVADVLPAPVAAVADETAWFPVPAGVTIVTTADPVAERVGTYLTELVGGCAPRPGNARPAGGIALLLDPAYEDEAYALEVDAAGVTIRAGGGAGLFWGVQTLRQLMPVSGPTVVPGVRITDRPRFAYRGVMLDVARHFVDVATVKRLIDLVALYKLNHLHLHLTDDQGWRIVSGTWPRLVSVGAATQVGGGPGGCYTADDYRQIVAYAQERFVTVVPEIDLPGHTNAALVAYPELAYPGVRPKPYTGTRVGFSALCPHRTRTEAFLTDVLGEVAAMTPGPYLHIGGDEAFRMPAHDYAAIVTRAQQVVARHGKTAVGWHELAEAPLHAGTVLQYWGIGSRARAVTAAVAAGHRVIMSPADRTYLDQRYSWRGPGRLWAGPISVERAYDWDPASYLAGVDESVVLGVEAPLWTERVSTQDEIEYLAFPRLAALAEIGWSPRATHDWVTFRHRLGAQAPRWEALGVAFARVPGVPWVSDAAAPSPRIPAPRDGGVAGDDRTPRRPPRAGGPDVDPPARSPADDGEVQAWWAPSYGVR
ncbi:MAG: beta-N-acetylhexosaminidase [Micromonosporaceae bacterium]|nr:beta-N-acetylhexosaminidase [Micromonosporaceae bacterium]